MKLASDLTNVQPDELVAIQILNQWFTCEFREVHNIAHLLRTWEPRLEKKWLAGARRRHLTEDKQPYPKGQRRPSTMVAMMDITYDTGGCGNQAIGHNNRPVREHLQRERCNFCIDGKPTVKVKLTWEEQAENGCQLGQFVWKEN